MNTTALPDAVEAYLSENGPQLVDFLETLVGFDTQSPPGETAEAVDWLESALDVSGMSTERVEVDPEKPNLLVELPGAADRTLCFNGHLDTVPFDETDWSYAPLGERDGDRVYGCGATDMKGGVAAMVQVALAYATTDSEPPVSLQFAFVSDEETGGDAGLPTLFEMTAFEPDACVVGETTSRGGRYSVSVADRGKVWLTLEASGVAAHGSRPMTGENAIDALTEAVARLRSEFGQWELSLDAAMEEIIEESVGFYEPESGADAARRLYRYPTLNLGVIEGGTAINTVPSSAKALVDIRLTAGVDMREAIHAIRNCLQEIDEVDITELTWASGTYEPIDSPIVEASVIAAESVIDERIYRRSATGGGDAKTFRLRGIPTVEFGFGTQTAHGTDEYTTTTALTQNATAYAILPQIYADLTA